MRMEPVETSEADAAHWAAVMAAEGTRVPQDWTMALSHLRRSAELGSRLAQAELAGLSGEWALAHRILAGEAVAESWWPKFHDAIDIGPWLTECPVVTVSEAPRMKAVPALAPPEICDWLIARSLPRLEAAQIYEFDGKESSLRSAVDRTNSVCVFGGRDRDVIIAILRARIAEVIPADVRAMEPPEVLRYRIGQQYRPHYDRPADPNAPDIRKRMISLLISLAGDYDGGETDFPLAGRRWKGRKGNAIFFWNVMPDGARDRLTLHAALPITRGEKWILTQFIDEPRNSGGAADANG